MPNQYRDASWSCAYCGLEGFHSYEDATAHELQDCPQASRKRQRPGSPEPQYAGMGPLNAAVAGEMGGDYDSRGSPKMRRISLMTPDERHDLDMADAAACQNLEIFEASMDHVAESEAMRAAPIIPGQVGIRCVHCVRHAVPPDYGFVFPAHVGMIGPSVQILAERHLIRCPMAPRQLQDIIDRGVMKRRRDHEENRMADEDRRQRALFEHCNMFCRQVGIVDQYPPKSGICFSDADQRHGSIGHEDAHEGNQMSSANRPMGPPRSLPPMMGQMGDDSIAATPLARRTKDSDRPHSAYAERDSGYSGYQPQYPQGSGSRGMYGEGMGPHTPHAGPEGPPLAHGGPPHESPPAAGYPPYGGNPYEMSPQAPPGNYPYFQDMNGSWTCRYCSSIHPQHRDQGSVWNGPSPPPNHFIDQHLSLCRPYNHSIYQAMPPPQAMYQGQPHPHHSYSYPPPQHSGHYGGPSPHAPPQGWGTPGSQPHGQPPPSHGGPPMSTPMHPHYSTPHAGGEPNYHYPPPPESHEGMMPEGHGDGIAQPVTPRAPPQGSLRPDSNDYATRQAIDYLVATEKESRAIDAETGISGDLVLEEDKMLLTDYFFHLMKQLRLCRFSESDRKTRGGKRENIAIGYGGLQCIHCADAPNARKFFWSNVDRLANSFAEIPGHVLKCRRCPNQTKTALGELKVGHPQQMARLPRGSQKVFFRRMWRRLHDSDPSPDNDSVDEKQDEVGAKTEENESAGEAAEASPVSHRDDAPDLSPGTSGEESAVVFDRCNEDAAKALAASITQASPPSPSSRVLLSISDDKDWLSDMDCFIRRNLEVFCATEEDVEAAQLDRKYPVNFGQVGIRCIHCAQSKGSEGVRGNAVAFPFSINAIYESVREFQRLHLETCPNLPRITKAKFEACKGSASLSSVLRRYYIAAAKALGMYDTTDGIRCGGESVPVVATVVAFDFSEGGSRVAEEMRRGSGGSFLDTAVTPLESRKRKPLSHEEGPESGSSNRGYSDRERNM